ncbi:MAG: MarR family winged helix-turn-helix transcriptional regulator [Janthinobacterium lividum]
MFDQCIYFNTTALARTLEREWAVAYRAFGLTPPQGFMLRAVLLKPGMLQGELAEALSISRSTATRTLDGLEKLALVERHSTPDDGRQLAIHPTDAARNIESSLNEASAALTRRLKQALGADVFSKIVTEVKHVKSRLA